MHFTGSFFAKALFTRNDEEEEDEEQLLFKKNDLLMVRDTGQGETREGTMLASGNHGLVPVSSMQPLPYPFYQWVNLPTRPEATPWLTWCWNKSEWFLYQMIYLSPTHAFCLLRWFLRKYPCNTGCLPTEKEAFEHATGKNVWFLFKKYKKVNPSFLQKVWHGSL